MALHFTEEEKAARRKALCKKYYEEHKQEMKKFGLAYYNEHRNDKKCECCRFTCATQCKLNDHLNSKRHQKLFALYGNS